MAFAYSVRFRRCSTTEPGFGCAAALRSISALQPVPQLLVLRQRRTRHAGRRHHAGAQLADHLFPDLRMVADRVEVGRLEREVGGLELVVVAGDAVLIEQRTFRCWSWRHSPRLHGGLRRKGRSQRGSGSRQSQDGLTLPHNLVRSVLEMFMQVAMFAAHAILADRRYSAMLRAQVGLP